MDHLDLEERWLDLAEGTLPDAEARELRVHLQECLGCGARYAALEAAHRRSLAAGREAARGALPVPPAIAARVREEARRAARAPAARWPWVVGPLLTAAAAAAVLLVVHPPERAFERQLRASLSALEPRGGLRGPGEPVFEAAAQAAARWRAGELRARASAASCPGPARTASGLVDARGAVALLALGEGDRRELHFYGPDGREAAAARLDAGTRAEFLVAPLPEGEARALLEGSSCPPPLR